MAKFYGKIGFGETVETSPGVWTDEITEKSYCGDLNRNVKRIDSGQQVNDNININNEISIISDPYANKNFHLIKYVEYLGTKWKVSSVTVNFPRLVLSINGIWNGEEADNG